MLPLQADFEPIFPFLPSFIPKLKKQLDPPLFGTSALSMSHGIIYFDVVFKRSDLGQTFE